MTFPSGGPGYPQQGGGQQPPGPPPSGGFPQQQPPHSHQASSGGPALPQNLPLLLALVVAGLGVVEYFLGFAADAGTVAESTLFALVAAGLAGLHLLPKGPRTLPFAGLFALLSGLEALDAVIGAPVVGGIVVVVLILSVLQLVAGVGAVLLEYDVLKLSPAAKPAAPQGGQGGQYGGPPQQFGQQGGPGGPQGGQQSPYGGPPQFGQAPQGPVAATGEPSAPFPPHQAPYTGPTPPSTNPPPQATTYAPMQGQFFQQPPSDQPPGTPPGGFGKSS